jgi:sugar phosphate isomerase/epimerase
MFLSGIADEAGNPLETQIRAHQELGWKHIEIRNVNDTTLALAEEKQFDQIRSQLQKAGMQVSCFASRIANWSRDILGPFEMDVDELKRSIPRMRKMNTPYIRIMSYTNKTNLPEAQWRAEALRRIGEMVKMAEDGGVTLVHENCDGWGGLGPKQTLDLIETVGSPALKLVFDTGNTVPHGHASFDYYAQVKPHVAYVHIKDMRKTGDKSSPCYPGEGQGDVAKIVRDLLSGGYEGGISIEPHIAAIVHEGKTSDPAAMYNTYVEYGRRLMALVEKVQKEAGRKRPKGGR